MTAAILAAVSGVLPLQHSWAMPSVYPTGVTVYNKDKAWNTDVLFSSAGQTRIINMDGKVLKTWNMQGSPAAMVDPKTIDGKKGVVGLQISNIEASKVPGMEGVGLVPGVAPKEVNRSFGLVDWNGQVMWQWEGTQEVGAALQNHDWSRLPNGNILILSDKVRQDSSFKTKKIIDDIIYEVNPQGKVIWQWSATDHLNEFGFTPEQMKLVKNSDSPDYLHMNDMQVLGPNKWEKAGDQRFAADNVIFSSRNANFTAIIDHKTGHIVWRIGPNYPALAAGEAGTLPRPVDQISGQHDPHMIPEGLPGAGNILMFDNQGEAGYPRAERALLGGSRVLEINPVTKEIVWEYTGRMSGQSDFSFFSPYISSVQRLPNGNTLIDEGINSRFFQVTPKGEIVWEYMAPYTRKTVKGAPRVPTYRIQAVPSDWLPASYGF